MAGNTTFLAAFHRIEPARLFAETFLPGAGLSGHLAVSTEFCRLIAVRFSLLKVPPGFIQEN